MRKRLALIVTAALALFVGAAVTPDSVLARTPIVQDVCACGGGSVLIWWQNLGNGTCLYVYRRDQSPYLDNVIRPC